MLKNIEPISTSAKGNLEKSKNVTAQVSFPLSMLGFNHELKSNLQLNDSEDNKKRFVVKYAR